MSNSNGVRNKFVESEKLLWDENGRSENEENEAVMSAGGTTLKITLWILLKLLNILFIPVFIYRVFQKPKICPPIQDEILLLPASMLAASIRKKELTCEQVLSSYITRIKEVNPLLNAVIEDRFDAALEEAKHFDKLISSDSLSKKELEDKYPLLGVPITIKGSLAVAGLNHTAGMLIRRDFAAVADARAVAMAKEAGAIPIGGTNVPELCLNWETENKLVGTTNNPYDSTRTVGGSSGGEACLLASAASIIGIGSDIAGSLRLPAHFCGVWGHKPTPGVVSFVGHYPSCRKEKEWEAFFTVGPMARYAGDLKLLLSIIAEEKTKKDLQLDVPVDISDLKVYYMEGIQNLLVEKVNGNCARAIQQVAKHFNTTCKTKCKKVKPRLIENAPELASLRLLDLDEVDNLFEGKGDGSVMELLRFFTCRSKSTLTAISYGILRKICSWLPTGTMERTDEKLTVLRNELLDMLKDDGVFILPVFTAEAHKHGDVLRKLLVSGYMSIFNAIGFPATSCPVLYTKHGLPVGVQVVAAPNCDRLTLAAAEEIEKAFGGWKPPSVIVNADRVSAA